MTGNDKFRFEMMSTPELANEMRLVKDEVYEYARQKKSLKHDYTQKREYAEIHRRWRNAKNRYNELDKIIRSRQLTLF